MMDLIASLEDKRLPFVLFKSPFEDQIQCYFQKIPDSFYTEDLSEQGFVFAPFELQTRYLFIPSTYATSFSSIAVDDDKVHQGLTVSDSGKESFIRNVNQARENIQKQSLEKVVLSSSFSFEVEANALGVFSRLAKKHPEAFVYYWSHPDTGKWLGASPEKLLSIKESKMSTMSLAGTLPANATEGDWTDKEKHEQALVTAHIQNRLLEVTSADQIRIGGRRTIKAGSLMHLCTPVYAKLNHVDWKKIIHLLHPTPAVGGLPVKQAIKFIQYYESTSRSYYTGFMGPFYGSKSIDLFVNLRCGKINADRVTLFAGAGITSQSDPPKEWDEIKRKASTFLTVL